MKEPVTYDCKQCGKRFVVSESGEGHLSPLYCCGVEAKIKSKRRSSVKKRKHKKEPSRKTG